jgi:two-component system cell cycle sensor histidine kinase/response regulator CckA
MKRGNLDLHLFLQELNELLLRTLPENIQLSLDSGVAQCVVNADPTRLQQVVLNLAINARDALPDGGTLAILLEQVEIGGYKERPFPTMIPGSWARLSFSDSGPGISEADLPHIFEPFFTTKGAMGSGLGLAQVHGIVKQHGGYVDVITTQGEGTRFDLYLPILPEIKVNVDTAVPALVAEGQGEIILIVEDDPHVRAVLQESLETFNFGVLTAVNGREALAIYQSRGDEIALVISDMVMPEMGGEQLLRALQQLNPAIKVIIITGYPLESVSAELQESDAVAWLQKPINLDQLSNIVGGIMQEAKLAAT